jgi:hypothetical protein
MSRKVATTLTALLAISALPSVAHAAPGLGDEVYGATVEPKEWEIETRYGALAGGADDGEDNFRLEAAYGLNGHTRIAAVAEFEKEPGRSRKFEAGAIEVIQNIGRIGPIDVALYGEYEAVRGGTDALEAKLLLQYRGRLTDLRFNLETVKPLAANAKVELAYAASADVSVAENLRLGVTAFGDLGTFGRFAPYAQHFAGPSAKFHIAGLGAPLKVETGYLFAMGAAKSDTSGMFRLNLEIEL